MSLFISDLVRFLLLMMNSLNLKITVMLNKYFKNTSYSVGSLVKEYKKLAHKYHPDAGGTNEDFVAMTKELD